MKGLFSSNKYRILDRLLRLSKKTGAMIRVGEGTLTMYHKDNVAIVEFTRGGDIKLKKSNTLFIPGKEYTIVCYPVNKTLTYEATLVAMLNALDLKEVEQNPGMPTLAFRPDEYELMKKSDLKIFNINFYPWKKGEEMGVDICSAEGKTFLSVHPCIEYKVQEIWKCLIAEVDR